MLRKRTLAGVAFCLLLSGLVFLPLSPAHAVSCGQKSVQAWTNNTNGNTTHYGVKAAWGIWVATTLERDSTLRLTSHIWPGMFRPPLAGSAARASAWSIISRGVTPAATATPRSR